MLRVLFVVNAPEFFLSHRLPLAEAARAVGYDVHVATGPGDATVEIGARGFVHHVLPLSRSGRNPLAEAFSLWSLFRLFFRLKPHLVHLVTIKPVLYGGLVSRFVRVPALVAAISGLGTVFVGENRRARFVRKAVEVLYRLALGHPNLRVIFQNPDDRATLVSLGALREDQAVMIRGSGVALADYPIVPETDGVPVVAFAARLLKEKGVLEFVEASRILKNRGVDARFWLIGTPDPGNPSSVDASDVADWAAEGLIESFGYRDDIAALFAQSHVVVLPSYYGEGLPKVLIEAAACGRAVVTTNHPGCRDAIESGKTGVLVPVRDATALADTVQILLADAGLRRRMGEAGRALAEKAFSIEQVIDAHLEVYRELLSAGGR